MITENLLLAEFVQEISQPGWEYFLEGKPPGFLRLRVTAPSRKAALAILDKHSKSLLSVAEKMRCFVGYKDAAGDTVAKLFEILTERQLETNRPRRGTMSNLIEVECPAIVVTLPLLRTFDEILSSNASMGLVRIADEQQLAVNGGANGEFLAGASKGFFNQFKRSDYWKPSDLENFSKDWRQRLQSGSKNWTEFTYRVRYPEPGKPLGAGLPPDRLMTSAFRLVDDGNGNFYHLCKNVAWQEI